MSIPDKRDFPFFSSLLVQACNLVRSSPIPADLIGRFNEFRTRRNSLFHTFDARLAFSDKEILRYVLSIVHLVAPRKWPSIRKDFLEETPAASAIGDEYTANVLCAEMRVAVDVLGRSEVLEYFGFDKKTRAYVCPKCYDDFNRDADPEHPRFAQLRPYRANAHSVYCFVCDRTTEVRRKKCSGPRSCKGNVISTEGDGECLTCLELQDE